MEDQRKCVLIRSRRGAAVGFAITGFAWIQAIRRIVSHSPTEPDPFVSMFSFFVAAPTWSYVAISIAFWAFYGWTILAFCRAAQGKERILFTGWLLDFILIPVRSLGPPAFAPAIQYMRAIAMGIATLAALLLIWQTYPEPEPYPEADSAPASAGKPGWIWLALIFIVSLCMVIYYMPRGR